MLRKALLKEMEPDMYNKGLSGTTFNYINSTVKL